MLGYISVSRRRSTPTAFSSGVPHCGGSGVYPGGRRAVREPSSRSFVLSPPGFPGAGLLALAGALVGWCPGSLSPRLGFVLCCAVRRVWAGVWAV